MILSSRTILTAVCILINGASSVSLDLLDIGDWATQIAKNLVFGDDFDGSTDLDDELQQILDEFKRSADEIFADTLDRTKEVYKLQADEGTTRTRHKRSAVDRDEDGVLDEFGDIYDLVNIEPIARVDVTASRDIETFEADDVLYWASTNGSTSDTQDEVKIFSWDTGSHNITLVQTFATADVLDIEPIDISGVIYLAVAESNSGSDFLFPGTVIYQFNTASQEFEYIQRIWTTGAHTVTSLEIEGTPALIIGAAFETTDTDGELQEMSAGYLWLGGHFDRFTTFPTHNASDIHPFTIHSRHYLVIANYADMSGDVDINSEILMYNSHTHLLEHFQYIETHGALDWEYFGFGDSRHREHFLAVVNNPDHDVEYQSMIYKYHDGEFVPFQCILTTGAERWHAVNDEDGDLAVLALATISGVEFYEYDGWWFKATDLQYSDYTLQASSHGFTSLLWNNTCILGVAEGSVLGDDYNIFELFFSKFSPLQDRHTELEEACEVQKMRFNNLTLQQEVMRNQSNDLVYINSEEEQVISGNIELLMNVTVQNMQVNKVIARSGMILDEAGLAQLAAIKSLNNNHTIILNELEDTWDNRTMKIYGDQIVTGEKEFNSISVTSEMKVNSLRVLSGIINSDISLDDLDNNTARTDRTQTFTAPITFANQVTIQGDLHVAGEIDDGIYSSNLVTLTNNHTITAEKRFQAAVNIYGNLDVDGTIDGIDVSAESILLVHGNQTFTGNLTFLGDLYYEDNVNVDGLVAGVDLSELKVIAVYHDGIHTITGNKTFSGAVTMAAGMVIADGYLIDGVDIGLLNETTMRISMEQDITGTMNFSQDLSILGNLQVEGSINDLYIPDSVVIVNEEDEVTLYGELTFDNDVTFNNLWCTDELDGINCHSDGSDLDILQVSGNQVVSGDINFLDDIWLDGASDVTGLVDGVDVPSLAADAVYNTGNQNISGIKIFNGSITFQQNITVEELLQGVNLTELDERAIKLSDGKLDADGQLIFDGPVTFEQALVTNGNHDFGNLTISDLVTQGSAEDIHGMKVFIRDVLSEDFFNVTGYVNDICLQDFYRDAVMTTDVFSRQLTANFTFTDDITVAADLQVSELIDGVNLTDVVSVNGAQVISGKTTFANDLLAGTLVVNGSLSIDGLLNGANVSELAMDTLLKKGDQRVTGTKTFQDGLTFEDDVTIDGLLEGVNITELAADAVYKTGDHVVSAEKTFDSQVQIQELNVTGTVDGVDINSLYSRAVQQNQSQTITGNYTFLSDVVMANNLTVLGNISGYQLEYEVNNMVFITDPVIDVEIHFGNVSSEGNVDIDGLIDSVDVGVEAILTNLPNQTITGAKTFTGSVTLLADLEVDTVCGLDIEHLEATTVTDDLDQTITAHKTFIDEVVLQRNLHVDGLVDGVNLTHLALHAMRTEDDSKPEQRVTVEAAMENVNVFEVVYYNGTLDGVDLVKLNQTYLSLTLPQTINASKTFTGTVLIASSGSLRGNGITLQGYINGIDLGEFAAGAFVSGEGQTVGGLKTFVSNITVEGDISVDGLVDGIKIQGNVMRTDRNSFVTGNKTFNGGLMVVQSAIVVGDGILVDGVDVSEWSRFAARTTDNYIVPISISITALVLEQNLVVGGLIDNILMDFDGVLTTIQDQVVTGHKSFVTDVIVQGDLNVDRHINGIDIVELFTDTLLKSRPQVITGSYALTAHPTFGNITTQGLVDGVRILDLYRQIHTYPEFDVLNISLLTTCEIIDNIKVAQENMAVILEHLQTIQEITTIGHGRWHGYTYNGTQFLVEAKRTERPTDGCVDSRIYYWDETQQSYVLETTLELIMASAVDTFIQSDRLFMVISSLNNDTNGCITADWMLSAEDADPDGIVTHEKAILPPEYHSNTITSILVQNSSSSDFYLVQHLPCISPSDVETFVDPYTLAQCVAIANERDLGHETFNSRLYVYIYCGDGSAGFEFRQAIPTFGAKKVTHFFVDGVLHLAIANRVDSEEDTFLASSAIWWQTEQGDFTQLDTVETSAASDVLVAVVEGDTYVIFANEFEGTISEEDYDVPVQVYEYIPGTVPHLEWRQDISALGARSLGHFVIEEQDFLLVVDRQDTVTVYRFNGIMMFESVHLIPVYGAVSLEVITLPHVDRIQIAVMCYAHDRVMYREQVPNPITVSSLILEAIIIGDKLDAFGCTET